MQFAAKTCGSQFAFGHPGLGMRIPGLPRKVFEPAPFQQFTVLAYLEATLPRSRAIALASWYTAIA